MMGDSRSTLTVWVADAAYSLVQMMLTLSTGRLSLEVLCVESLRLRHAYSFV